MKTIGTLTLLFIGLNGMAFGQDSGCANWSLQGTFVFTITGQILAPAPAAGPVAGIAVATFDGAGTVTQIDHVVHNGVPPVEDWRPATGNYTVNADCTGTFTLVPQPTVAADNSPALKVYFSLSNQRKQINAVVSGSPTTPPFMATILSTGTRIY